MQNDQKPPQSSPTYGLPEPGQGTVPYVPMKPDTLSGPIVPEMEPPSTRQILPRFKLFRTTSLAILSSLLILGVGYLILSKTAHNVVKSPASDVPDQSVSLGQAANSVDDLRHLDAKSGPDKKVIINGDVITTGSISVINSDFLGQIRSQTLHSDQSYTLPDSSGVFCLDSNNCGFAAKNDVVSSIGGQKGPITLGSGLSLQGTTLTASAGSTTTQVTNSFVTTGVTTAVNSLTGVITLQGTANQVGVSSSGNVITFSTPQDISVSSSPSFQTITLTSAGTQGGNTICDSSNNCGFSTVAGAYVQGGNSFGAVATLGTNDNNSLVFETNDASRVTIDTTGNVGISAASNGAKLYVPYQTGDAGGVTTSSLFGSNALVQIGDSTNVNNNLVALDAETYSGIGVQGIANTGIGVFGASNGNNNLASGVLGYDPVTGGAGVIGLGGLFGSGDGIGVVGYSGTSFGVSGQSANGISGFFQSTCTGLFSCAGSSAMPTLVTRQYSNSSTNLFEAQDSAGNPSFQVDANGQVLLGRASALTGSTTYYNASGSGKVVLQTTNPGSTNYSLNLPAEDGTLCSTGSVCTGYAPANGGLGYIQNGTSLQTNANFAIQSAAANSVGGVIRGATNQTADLQQWQDSSGNALVQLKVNDLFGIPTFTLRNRSNSGTTTINNASLITSNGTDQIELDNDGSIFSSIPSTGYLGYRLYVTGESRSRFTIAGDGMLSWGDGANASDTSLYRSAANILKTDGKFVVGTLGAADTGTFLCRNSANEIASCMATGAGTPFVQGGNSFAAPAMLGTNDAYDLSFQTDGIVACTIRASDQTLSCPGAGALSERFGRNSAADGAQAIALGVSSNAGGDYSVALGTQAFSSGTSSVAIGIDSAALNLWGIAIGESALSNADNALAIGSLARSQGTGSLAYGVSSFAHNGYDIALGYQASASNGTSIALGKSSVASGANSIGIGTNTQSLGANSIVLGSGYAGSSGSVAIGFASEADDSRDLAVGYSAFASGGSSTAVGESAVAENGTTAIGSASHSEGFDSIALGYRAHSGGDNSLAFGDLSSSAGIDAIAIGYWSTSSANQGIALGSHAASNYQNSIALGNGASTSASNELAVGGTGYNITDGYFGSGAVDSTPAAFTFHATGGSGTDITGADLGIAGGRGTGSANGGKILFQTAAAGVSGSTLQPLATVAQISGSTLEVGSTSAPGTNEKFRVNTPTTVDNTTAAVFASGAAANKGLIVQGAASQTANLQDWQGSTGTALSYVKSNGAIRVGSDINFSTGGIPIFSGQDASKIGIALRGFNSNKTDLLFETQGNPGNQQFAVYGRGNTVINLDDGTAVGLTIKADAAQSANLQEWQNNSATVLANVTASGLIQAQNGLEVASTGAQGTVEKFRVNTPTAVDNTASAIITTGGLNNKGLVIQTAASQANTAYALQIQTNTGTDFFHISTADMQYNSNGGNTWLGGATQSWRHSGGQTSTRNDSGAAFNQLHGAGQYSWSMQSAAVTGDFVITGGGNFLQNSDEYERLRIAKRNEFQIKAYRTTATVTNKALTSNVATITTSTAHGLLAGMTVVVSGVDATFNGTYAVTSAPSATTFTYARVAADVASQASAGTTVGYQTQTNSLLDFYEGTAGSVVASLTNAGTLKLNSSGTPGTVEKLRVNTPTTIDNTANAIISTSSTASKGLVVQGSVGQTANVFEVQSSDAIFQFAVASSGSATLAGNFTIQNGNGISMTGDINGSTSNTDFIGATTRLGANPSATGALRMANTGAINWRNAANNADISGVSVTSSDVLQLAAAVTTNDATATASIGTTGTAKKGLVIQGVASQSADLTEWQDSTGVILAKVDSLGRATFGSSSTGLSGVVATGTYAGLSAASYGGTAIYANAQSMSTVGLKVQSASNLYTGDLQRWDPGGVTASSVTNSGFFKIGATGSLGTVERLRIVDPTTTDNTANVMIAANATTSKALVIQAAASQSAELTQWQDSTGARMAGVDAYGNVYSGNFSGVMLTPANTTLGHGAGVSASNGVSIFHWNNSVNLTPGESGGVGFVNTLTTSASGAITTTLTTGKAASVVAAVKGAASQSANLQEWQTSTGTVLASVSAGGNLTVVNATVNGTLTVNGNATVNGHIITGNSSGSTAVAAGAGAGAGANASISGNDTSGKITITTGTGSSTGVLGTVTFAQSFVSAPNVTLTPANGNGSSVQYFAGSSTTTTFTIDTNNAPADGTTYTYYYHVMQ